MWLMELYCGFLVECSGDCDTENFFMFLDHLDVFLFFLKASLTSLSVWNFFKKIDLHNFMFSACVFCEI